MASKRNPDHIHSAHDGRGQRVVFCNGKELTKCFFADTKRGIADCYLDPPKIHKRKKRLISKRYRGRIEVKGV